MRLSNLNKYFFVSLFITLSFFSYLNAENQIDIWKKDNKKDTITKEEKKDNIQENLNLKVNTSTEKVNKIKIEENLFQDTLDVKIYGIHDPEKYNFKLSLWSNTESKEIKKTISRISKLKLSKTAEEIFQDTLLTFSYTPINMSIEEFLEIKINWLINNQKDYELKLFLEKNKDFHFQEKIIKYLVDKSIANTDIKKACEDINFLSKDIKNSYLEKFKIYCFVFNKNNDQALLLYDILKEEKQSDKFFDDKIQFLLGIKDKTSQKVADNNLLNFYLSSITINNFKYTPKKSTPKFIWDYMDSANLIDFNIIEDMNKINELEIAANENRIDPKKIFSLYEKIPFDLDQLIRASDIYNTLGQVESRAIIYQKFLLSDNEEKKIEFLFLLKDLFDREKLNNVYTSFLSKNLKDIKNVPKEYEEVVKKNILVDPTQKRKKIKYNDKILHRSKVLKFYTEKGTSQKKTQKDLNNVFKKIKKNKDYFYSAKDLALIEALKNDGLTIPDSFQINQFAKQYDVPSNLLELAKKEEIGFLVLKIVEIIGEDEVNNLDPETIYFISHLLNKNGLKEIRNKILISSLPLKV
ncbi:MAG: hypothetical protein CL687_03435 [Candidatus Pelagibacter sp.]|nr:hypothetical protein [Candidatus Pelagibacter sp.]